MYPPISLPAHSSRRGHVHRSFPARCEMPRLFQSLYQDYSCNPFLARTEDIAILHHQPIRSVSYLGWSRNTPLRHARTSPPSSDTRFPAPISASPPCQDRYPSLCACNVSASRSSADADASSEVLSDVYGCTAHLGSQPFICTGSSGEADILQVLFGLWGGPLGHIIIVSQNRSQTFN